MPTAEEQQTRSQRSGPRRRARPGGGAPREERRRLASSAAAGGCALSGSGRAPAHGAGSRRREAGRGGAGRARLVIGRLGRRAPGFSCAHAGGRGEGEGGGWRPREDGTRPPNRPEGGARSPAASLRGLPSRATSLGMGLGRGSAPASPASAPAKAAAPRVHHGGGFSSDVAGPEAAGPARLPGGGVQEGGLLGRRRGGSRPGRFCKLKSGDLPLTLPARPSILLCVHPGCTSHVLVKSEKAEGILGSRAVDWVGPEFGWCRPKPLRYTLGSYKQPERAPVSGAPMFCC